MRRQSRKTVTRIVKRNQAKDNIHDLASFPEENPNPVFRIRRDGRMLSTNPGGRLLLQEWNAHVGRQAAEFIRAAARDVLSTGKSKLIDIPCCDKTYSFFIAPVTESGYANLYGTDVTERRRAEKEVQRNLDQIQALHEIGKAVSSTLDLQGMLDLLLEKVDLFLPYAASTVRLLNRETGFLEPIACRNMDGDRWKSRLPPELTRSYAATQTRRPLITLNLQTDPQTRDPTFFREQGLISCLRFPLIAKDEILGAIAFYTKQEHDFGTEEIQFLTSLANQAAIAIYNAQLYEQSQAHQLRASALYEVAATVNQSLNLDEILQGVIKKIAEISGFEAIRVLLLDPQGEELRLKAEHNRVPLAYSPPTTFRRGQGILGRIAETGEAMIYDDLQNDARYAEFSHSKASKSAGLSFFAGFPIKSKTRTLGVLLCVGQSPR